jgi:undecaprenyl diphosphate synthase
MDGNGRWAKNRGLPRREGHKQGVKTLKTLTRAADKIGISHLTVYAFSTENWKRPKPEVNFLLKLFSRTIHNEIDELKENDVKINVIGRRLELPSYLKNKIEQIEKDTAQNKGLNFNIAFNYGGRAEIVDAAKKICSDLDIDSITEDSFSDYLYDIKSPEVELLIRTGGEKRISNFLLWELAYAELYFTEKFWPEFTGEDLKIACEEFSRRNRRFGTLNKAGEMDVK